MWFGEEDLKTLILYHYYMNNINYILGIKTVLLFWFLLYEM